MKPILIFSTVVFFVSTARIPYSNKRSHDILYHLVCNFSSIQHVFYYPINDDGKVAEDLVFNPFQIHPGKLTQTAVEYMSPICTKFGTTENGINHEWFISSESFTKHQKVIIQYIYEIYRSLFYVFKFLLLIVYGIKKDVFLHLNRRTMATRRTKK